MAFVAHYYPTHQLFEPLHIVHLVPEVRHLSYLGRVMNLPRERAQPTVTVAVHEVWQAFCIRDSAMPSSRV